MPHTIGTEKMVLLVILCIDHTNYNKIGDLNCMEKLKSQSLWDIIVGGERPGLDISQQKIYILYNSLEGTAEVHKDKHTPQFVSCVYAVAARHLAKMITILLIRIIIRFTLCIPSPK